MNLDIYTEEMSKSVWDKAFFMDKIIGAKLVIDFGCADGAMIRMLAPLFPNTTFYGYDINDDLIYEAWTKLESPADKNTFFFHKERIFADRHDSFEDMIAMATQYYKPDEICINFSSVLHEVFSSSPSGKETIRRLIEELRPKYITVRDMYFDYNRNIVTTTQREHVINQLKIDPKYIEEFEKEHGTIVIWRNFIHFLMKYQWKDNGWEQEMKEDYFSWTLKDLINLVGDYTSIFETHYQLPYYTEAWKNLFFIPTLHTHAQFILRRNY